MSTVVVDDYPTRVQNEPRIFRRPDPVVWGDGERRNNDVAAYARDGYVQRERAISSARVRECLDEIERIGADPGMAEDPRVIREGGTQAVRSIFDVHLLSDAVWAAVEESGAIELAKEILGSDVTVHQSRLNYKPGFAGGAFYWHSDFETWHAEDGMPRPRACSASIALTPNREYNGPLMIMPGTQRYFVQTAGETPDDFYNESLVTTGPTVGSPSEEAIAELGEKHGIDLITGPEGSITMFDCNALHASGGNITPMPRSNIFVVFNSVDNKLTEPFAGTAPRPEYLARR